MTLILDKDNPLATKVQTRDGRKARVICVDRFGHFPIIALATNIGGEQSICATSGGIAQGDPNNDLINAPVTHKAWVNILRGKDGGPFSLKTISGCAFWSKDDADADAAGLLYNDRIACIEIEFKEGDGL